MNPIDEINKKTNISPTYRVSTKMSLRTQTRLGASSNLRDHSTSGSRQLTSKSNPRNTRLKAYSKQQQQQPSTTANRKKIGKNEQEIKQIQTARN